MLPDQMIEACADVMAYLKDSYDASDEDGTGMRANKAMQLGMKLEAALVNAGVPDYEDYAS